MKVANPTALQTCGLPTHAIEAIRSVLADFPVVERAVLYGSRAKGTFKTGSDIDLSLFGEALTDQVLLQIERRLDDLMLPYTIDLSRFDAIQNPELIEHIQRVGKCIYAR